MTIWVGVTIWVSVTIWVNVTIAVNLNILGLSILNNNSHIFVRPKKV